MERELCQTTPGPCIGNHKAMTLPGESLVRRWWIPVTGPTAYIGIYPPVYCWWLNPVVSGTKR